METTTLTYELTRYSYASSNFQGKPVYTHVKSNKEKIFFFSLQVSEGIDGKELHGRIVESGNVTPNHYLEFFIQQGQVQLVRSPETQCKPRETLVITSEAHAIAFRFSSPSGIFSQLMFTYQTDCDKILRILRASGIRIIHESQAKSKPQTGQKRPLNDSTVNHNSKILMPHLIRSSTMGSMPSAVGKSFQPTGQPDAPQSNRGLFKNCQSSQVATQNQANSLGFLKRTLHSSGDRDVIARPALYRSSTGEWLPNPSQNKLSTSTTSLTLTPFTMTLTESRAQQAVAPAVIPIKDLHEMLPPKRELPFATSSQRKSSLSKANSELTTSDVESTLVSSPANRPPLLSLVKQFKQPTSQKTQETVREQTKVSEAKKKLMWYMSKSLVTLPSSIPMHVSDLPEYAKLPAHERAAALENIILTCIDDEAFMTLCEDVEAIFRRIEAEHR